MSYEIKIPQLCQTAKHTKTQHYRKDAHEIIAGAGNEESFALPPPPLFFLLLPPVVSVARGGPPCMSTVIR